MNFFNKRDFYNFNFLTEEILEKRSKKKVFIKLILDLSIAFIILFIYIFLLKYQSSNTLSSKILLLQKKYKKLKVSYLNLKIKIKNYKDKIKFLQKQKFLESINITPLIFIERFLPDNLSLSYLHLKDKLLKIKGYSNSPKYIYQYLEILKKEYNLTGFQIKPSRHLFKFEAEFLIK